jgi:hypothetical protein
MAYSIWQIGMAMFAYYAALFLACLTGVCAFVVIGNKLRRIYIELVGEYNDIYTSDEPGLDKSRHDLRVHRLRYRNSPLNCQDYYRPQVEQN